MDIFNWMHTCAVIYLLIESQIFSDTGFKKSKFLDFSSREISREYLYTVLELCEKECVHVC